MKFNIIRLEENKGQGISRAMAVEHCNNNLIFIMDADDIALPNRCEVTLDFYSKNPNTSVIGGQITEFIGDETNIIGMRKVPLSHSDIISYLRFRCPFNQMSVMIKKDDLIRVGGYRDWFCNEDYYLWLRMYNAGMQFANVPKVLVNVRVGNEMSARRGGWKYFSSETKLQSFMLTNSIISLPIFLYNVLIRFIGEIVVPIRLRTKLFRLIRHKYHGEDNKKPDIIEGRPISDSVSYPPFSVAMCVYGGDNASWFDTALESIIKQTVQPNEIVLVVDGPIPAKIKEVLDKYRNMCLALN